MNHVAGKRVPKSSDSLPRFGALAGWRQRFGESKLGELQASQPSSCGFTGLPLPK